MSADGRLESAAVGSVGEPDPSVQQRRRVAIVTGAAQGLGFGIAAALGREGHAVAIVDLDAAAVEAAAAALRERGMEVRGWRCDVTRPDETHDTVRAVGQALGPVSALVNNAQVTRSGPITATTSEDARVVWESGFLGTLHMMQACHSDLVSTRGAVVNIVSGAGLSAPAGYGIYAATKESIRTFTRVAALEWGPDGVRVNALSPSAQTAAFTGWAEAHPEEAAQRVDSIPLRRMGDAEADVGAAVAFLVSDAAGYITGTTLVVDGGAHHLG